MKWAPSHCYDPSQHRADAQLIIREVPPEDAGAQEQPNFTAASQEILTSPSAGKVVGRVQGLTDLRRR